jgi:hypothetical protein
LKKKKNKDPGASGSHLSSQLCRRLRSRSSQFQANPSKKKVARPHLNNKNKKIWACASLSNNSGKLKIGRSQSRMAWAKSNTLSPK